jgi:hypothetical protein
LFSKDLMAKNQIVQERLTKIENDHQVRV